MASRALPGTHRRLRAISRGGWRILIVVMSLVLCLPGGAAAVGHEPQPPEPAAEVDPTFRRLTVAQGLLHPAVRSILQDRRGFLWFATFTGVNRYDGYTMAAMTADNDPARLPTMIVYALAEDHESQIWVGSYTDGLAAYDPRTGRFARFPHDPQDAASPSANDVLSVLVDRSGALWVGTQSGGLNRRDPATGQFTRYRHDPADPASLSNDAVNVIVQDRAGTLWVGTQRGGLNRLDPATGRFTHYRHDVGNPASLSNDNVTTIHEDRAGTLWVGTQGGGLNRFDRATGIFTSYRNDPSDPLSLPHNSVLSLYEDTSGLLWVGTGGGGIGYFRLYGWPFQRYISQVGQPNSLAAGAVRGLAEDRDGGVWVGTFGGGLNRLDPATGQFTHYRHDPSDPTSLSDDLVWTLYVDRDGTLWVGTDGGFLNRFDRATGAFSRYHLGPSASNYLIHAIYQDRAGVMWLGSFGSGLIRFDPATGRSTAYAHDPSDSHSISHDFLQYVYEDRQGILWVATLGGGLNRFDRVKGEFTAYRHDPSDPSSIGSDKATALFEDQDGRLWVGTTAGLDLFDRATGRFTHYTDVAGLPSDLVQGIVTDGANLWISTLHGVSRLDPQTSTSHSFNVSDDLLSEGFTAGALLRARDRTIYAGGFGGLLAFDPAAIGQDTFAPPLAFTDFMVNNQPLAIGDQSPLRQPINETAALTLGEGDRTFSVEFAALDYWSPGQARYRYKLDGVDPDWVEVDSGRRFITYTRLRPGTYTLHVRAASRDGSWSGPERTLAITLPPFLWEWGWFRLGVIALFSLLVFGMLQFHQSQARTRQRQLEEQVVDRTKEVSMRSAELEQANARLEVEIAERARAEVEARESRDELATQLVVSQQIVATLDLDLLLDCILEQLERIERFDAATIVTVEGDELVMRGFRSALVTREVQGIQVDPERTRTLRTLIATRRPLIVADGAANAEELACLETVLGDTHGLHSWMDIPLFAKERVIGILSLFHHEVGYYGSHAQQRVQLFANQAALAIENAQLYEAAQEAAVLEERHRLAHDLHDAVTQSLFSASLIAEGLRDAANIPARERQGLEDLRQLTRGALAEMRALLYELRPSGLTEKPLGQLLDSLCTAFTSRTRIPVALTVTGSDRLQPQVQEMLYRIAQEALNNISKHAAATAARVALTCSEEEVVLIIADDGRGLEMTNGSTVSLGMGSMRDRAARIGAALHIDSRPGGGTTITVVWRADG